MSTTVERLRRFEKHGLIECGPWREAGGGWLTPNIAAADMKVSTRRG
jgi:hypothetical protein